METMRSSRLFGFTDATSNSAAAPPITPAAPIANNRTNRLEVNTAVPRYQITSRISQGKAELLEAVELQSQGGLIFLLCLFGPGTKFFFAKGGLLPFIDIRHGMVHRGERFLHADRGDP